MQSYIKVIITFQSAKRLSKIYATYWMRGLPSQALICTLMSNTAILKSTSTPIRAETVTNIERARGKKDSRSVSFKLEFKNVLVPSLFTRKYAMVSMFF